MGKKEMKTNKLQSEPYISEICIKKNICISAKLESYPIMQYSTERDFYDLSSRNGKGVSGPRRGIILHMQIKL